MIERYVGSGLIRFVYREFPMVQNHPAAQRASEAAVCAGKLDHYWEMNGKLYASVGEWGAQGVDPDSSFKRYARELGLDAAAFDECLDSGEAAIFVRGDMMAGEILGVDATPYFFVNDIPIRGARSIDALGQIIEYAAIGGRIPEIVPTGDDFHVRGDRETAKAVMVAFVDYANPESAQHALEVLPKLVATYVDAGSMLFVLHPWPDKDGTPGAQAAGAAECAGQQGKFWEMHDRLFDQQTLWAAEAEPRMLFNGYAESLGLDTSAFEACLDSNWAKLRVRAGGVVGALYGMPEPPIYLFNNGQALQESPTFEEFKAQIDSILNP